MIPNNPYARLDSFRIIFSVGSPPSIPVISGEPSFPAAGNPSDPNNNINYDFVEFTERSSPNDGILFINTTQVDQVGLPFTMQTTPKDAVKSNGVGITVSRPTLFTDFSTYIQQQFSSNTNTNAQAAGAAFQSLSTSYRLLNPSDAISNPPSSAASAFNTYFDAALTSFFNNYLPAGQTFRLQRDGYYFVGQTKENFSPPSVPGTFTVLQLQQTDSNWNVISGGQTYQIYAPYFSNGSAYPPNFPQSTPLSAAPPWIAPASAGEMVFGNSGAFADGAAQAADGQISGTGATGQILLDIENTIVSAFNRGVANSVDGNQTGSSDRSSVILPERGAPEDELHRRRFRALEGGRQDGRVTRNHQEQRTRQASKLSEVTHPSSAGSVSGTGTGPPRHRFGRGFEVVQGQVIRRGGPAPLLHFPVSVPCSRFSAPVMAPIGRIGRIGPIGPIDWVFGGPRAAAGGIRSATPEPRSCIFSLAGGAHHHRIPAQRAVGKPRIGAIGRVALISFSLSLGDPRGCQTLAISAFGNECALERRNLKIEQIVRLMS